MHFTLKRLSKDLLSKMLVKEVEGRATAVQLLEHKFLSLGDSITPANIVEIVNTVKEQDAEDGDDN